MVSGVPIRIIYGDITYNSFQEDNSVAGNWSGVSVCQQKNSACNDELAFYRIYQTKNPLIYQIDGYKILNKDTVNMGTLDFYYDQTNRTLTCINNNREWRLTITGNKIEGELWTSGKTLFRKIHLTKN
jgi:hypothetical protein